MQCSDNLVWHNSYKGAFDLISPDSYSHPAKMSPSLCYRILDHLKELNLLRDSDTILDPLSGTGMTAICAGAKGYRAISLELEEKFIGFQKQNKEYAGRKLCQDLDWTILSGDARKLSELLTERGLVTVSSPPYAEMEKRDRSTEPRWDEEREKKNSGGAVSISKGYQASDRNIGNLKDIPLKVITSPPYANRVDDHGVDKQGYEGFCDKLGSYGEAAGQIGILPDHPLKTVTSPPYDNRLRDEDREHHGGIMAREFEKGNLKMVESYSYSKDKENGNYPLTSSK